MSAYYTIGGNTISIGGAMLRELGTGTLTVVCAMDAVGGDYDRTKTFSVVVTFSRPVTYGGSTSTTHTLSMMGGQSVTFTDIPELTTFEVTESPLSSSDLDAGYSTGPVTGGTGTMSENGAYTATAQYYYMAAKTMRIRVSDGENPTTWDWRSDVTLSPCSSTSHPTKWDVSWTGNDTIELCKGFTHITSVLSANLWGVTNTNRMFLSCNHITSVSIFGTGTVTNMGQMFSGCTALTSVSLFDTSNVTTMHAMFNECHSLVSVPLFDTSNVKSTANMFMNCYSIVSVPLFNLGNVISMDRMFINCSSITAIPLFDTSSVTDVDYMFYECHYAVGGALALYNQMSTQATPPTNHLRCFYNCGRGTTTGAAELAKIPSGWK